MSVLISLGPRNLYTYGMLQAVSTTILRAVLGLEGSRFGALTFGVLLFVFDALKGWACCIEALEAKEDVGVMISCYAGFFWRGPAKTTSV